jgi:hypothetical protein
MGSVLSVPHCSFTMTEDFGMAARAALMRATG